MLDHKTGQLDLEVVSLDCIILFMDLPCLPPYPFVESTKLINIGKLNQQQKTRSTF